MMSSFSTAGAYALAAAGFEAAFIGGATVPGADGSHPSAATLYANGVRHIHLADTIVTSNPSIVTAAHAAGVRVWVYDVDTLAAWNTFKALGVDGCFTNQPKLVEPYPAKWGSMLSM